MDIERIESLIAKSSFITAYELILSELERSPGNPIAIEVSKTLSRAVRSKCMDLGMSKATEMAQETYEIEALLRVIIRLNGETVYG